MNATTRAESGAVTKPQGLELLRAPVPDHLISPLPKGTKAQNECPADQKITCKVCGGWHHPRVQHLSYVGHAAATHLLLDADPHWSWEPLGFTEGGLPRFDESGGLWIRLTVCGVSRLGYGHAEKKAHMDAGSREKEAIGDAIRNAAMRFGLALDLWSKADLHASTEDPEEAQLRARREWIDARKAEIAAAKTVGDLKKILAMAIAKTQENEDMEGELELREAAAAKTPQSKGTT